MTIDEVRTALEKERKYALHENKKAYDIAIDITRKYQKIKEIIENAEGDMIDIKTESQGSGKLTDCKIDGTGDIIAIELETLFEALLENNDLARVLIKVLDNVQEKITNKGEMK